MFSVRNLYLRIANHFHGPLEEKIVFVHVPKCGGTSVRHAVRECYLTLDIRKDRFLIDLNEHAAHATAKIFHPSDPFSNNYYDVLRLDEQLLIYFMSQDHVRYVAGHFSFSELAFEAFHDKYAFVSIIRDPVKRWVSHYFYNKYKKGPLGKINDELADYLESDRSRWQGSEYVKKFYGNVAKNIDFASNYAISQAKENLKKFAVVGCLEFPANFQDQFEKHFGIKPVFHKKNINPVSADYRRLVVSNDIEKKIKQICAPDIEIYEFVKNYFVK